MSFGIDTTSSLNTACIYLYNSSTNTGGITYTDPYTVTIERSGPFARCTIQGTFASVSSRFIYFNFIPIAPPHAFGEFIFYLMGSSDNQRRMIRFQWSKHSRSDGNSPYYSSFNASAIQQDNTDGMQNNGQVRITNYGYEGFPFKAVFTVMFQST